MSDMLCDGGSWCDGGSLAIDDDSDWDCSELEEADSMMGFSFMQQSDMTSETSVKSQPSETSVMRNQARNPKPLRLHVTPAPRNNTTLYITRANAAIPPEAGSNQETQEASKPKPTSSQQATASHDDSELYKGFVRYAPRPSSNSYTDQYIDTRVLEKAQKSETSHMVKGLPTPVRNLRTFQPPSPVITATDPLSAVAAEPLPAAELTDVEMEPNPGTSKTPQKSEKHEEPNHSKTPELGRSWTPLDYSKHVAQKQKPNISDTLLDDDTYMSQSLAVGLLMSVPEGLCGYDKLELIAAQQAMYAQGGLDLQQEQVERYLEDEAQFGPRDEEVRRDLEAFAAQRYAANMSETSQKHPLPNQGEDERQQERNEVDEEGEEDKKVEKVTCKAAEEEAGGEDAQAGEGCVGVNEGGVGVDAEKEDEKADEKKAEDGKAGKDGTEAEDGKAGEDGTKAEDGTAGEDGKAGKDGTGDDAQGRKAGGGKRLTGRWASGVIKATGSAKEEAEADGQPSKRRRTGKGVPANKEQLEHGPPEHEVAVAETMKSKTSKQPKIKKDETYDTKLTGTSFFQWSKAQRDAQRDKQREEVCASEDVPDVQEQVGAINKRGSNVFADYVKANYARVRTDLGKGASSHKEVMASISSQWGVSNERKVHLESKALYQSSKTSPSRTSKCVPESYAYLRAPSAAPTHHHHTHHHCYHHRHHH